jgi:hypothetical protein
MISKKELIYFIFLMHLVPVKKNNITIDDMLDDHT